MLYRTKAKDGASGQLDDLRSEFESIYKKYKVNIIGFWENDADSNEAYYLSKYEDEADYKSKTDQLRNDDRYTDLTKKLEEIRLESESVKLKPLWIPE